MVEKKSRWERKYNFREVLENFFPDSLITAINLDLDRRTITEICEHMTMVGEMPFAPEQQEGAVSRIIHEYLEDLQLKPEQRRWLTDSSKIILDRYVMDAYERSFEDPEFKKRIIFERASQKN